MEKFIIVLLLLNLGNLLAQKPYTYKATYRLEYQVDSTDIISIKSETGVLYLGNGHSRYSSLGKAVKDSLENMANPVMMRMDEYNRMTDFK